MSETLQLVNIALTSGVIALLVPALVAYGRLLQKVEEHERRLNQIEGRP